MGDIGAQLGKIGETIPPNDIHAISVSLPTWESTLGWATRRPEVISLMRSGYPRFFIHPLIDELARRIISSLSEGDDDASARKFPDRSGATALGMLFPSAGYARQCEVFLKAGAGVRGDEIMTVTLGMPSLELTEKQSEHHVDWAGLPLRAVIYPSDLLPLAKSFWQHTGFGISSRYAELYLKHLNDVVVNRGSSGGVCLDHEISLSLVQHEKQQKERIQAPAADISSYGKDEQIKGMLRSRIADQYSTSTQIGSEDVYLFPTGMSAFANVANALKTVRIGGAWSEIVCYGFLYVDTFKVISKVAQLKTTLYGHASLSELDTLEYRLQNGERIHALVLEVPQNPLLGSPDLLRIRQLSCRYDFIVICDDTIATAVNVDVLQFADIIVTSLSKMFSGACNVMGGSIIFNPRSARIADLRKILENEFVDTYFPPDADIMEFNSRDFVQRVTTATQNAEIIVDLLRQHECVQEVYYPKGSKTQHFYDVCKRPGGGYSYLLSIVFKKPEKAVAFFDALNVEKGPSLGTNFTLSCPYTLFAHYWEREWAKEFGLEDFLVRISIGLEKAEVLKGKVEVALDAALRAGDD